jgi:hypothetical protein
VPATGDKSYNLLSESPVSDDRFVTVALQEISNEDMVKVARRLGSGKQAVPLLGVEGSYDYPDLQGLDLKADLKQVLARMRDEGYLKETIAATILTCPKCGLSNLVSQIRCPSCSSTWLRKDRLIEHRAGGHIGPESEFRKTGQMICPVCKTSLMSESDYRVIGKWFVCVSCGSKNSQVEPELMCLKDGTSFDAAAAELKGIPRYELTAKGSSLLELGKNAILEALTTEFGGSMTVQKEPSLEGKSGVSHGFDMSLASGDSQLLVDLAFSKEPIEKDFILSHYAKLFDVGNLKSLVIAWPSLSSSAKSLAKSYKIETVESNELEDLKKKILEAVKKV